MDRVGAGLGATTANFKGGLGSASAATESGAKVAALAVVNAVGSTTVGDGPWFWAAPFEVGGEFGGRRLPPSFTPDMLAMRIKGGAAATSAENTTLAVVVTDAVLTKPQARRLAIAFSTALPAPDAHEPKHLEYEHQIGLAQARLLTLSSNTKQIFVPNSSEYVQFDDPDAVVDAIREVYDQSRAAKADQ